MFCRDLLENFKDNNISEEDNNFEYLIKLTASLEMNYGWSNASYAQQDLDIIKEIAYTTDEIAYEYCVNRLNSIKFTHCYEYMIDFIGYKYKKDLDNNTPPDTFKRNYLYNNIFDKSSAIWYTGPEYGDEPNYCISFKFK